MRIRFYIDPETDRAHVETHGITCQEVLEALERVAQDYMGDRGARIALGRTRAGRCLKVVYKPNNESGESGVFVITAYPLRGNELRAFRRRMARRTRRD